MARQGLTADIDFVESPSFLRQYDGSAAALAAKTVAAEKSQKIAELIAPHLSGDYKKSFVVAKQRKDILLGNTDFKANWIEFGTLGSPELNIPPWPAHATLRRSVRAAGYKLIENPRNLS